MKRLRTILLLLALYGPAAAQQAPPSESLPTLETLRQRDLSLLWTGPIPLLDREDTATVAWVERPEPLGFIGPDYRRLRIHIGSIRRSASDPLTYLLAGHTLTGRNLCAFEGELRIDTLGRYPVSGAPDAWGGIFSGWYLRGRYTLRERPDRPGTGVFEGTHTLDLAVDTLGTIYYDTCWLEADGYSNNRWQGTWRSYATGTVKVCNWGDFRIPASGALDGGAAEFIPGEDFFDKGWRSYRAAWEHPADSAARTAEALRWWQYAE